MAMCEDVLGFLFQVVCVQSGVHPGGVAQSHHHALHSHLPPEEQVSGDHRLLQELHSGGGWSWGHLLLCADGHQTSRQPNGMISLRLHFGFYQHHDVVHIHINLNLPLQWTSGAQTEASIYQQAENGKTELSLMHFTIKNPRWQPPQESSVFISHLKEKVQHDAQGGPSTQLLLSQAPLCTSLQSNESATGVRTSF